MIISIKQKMDEFEMINVKDIADIRPLDLLSSFSGGGLVD